MAEKTQSREFKKMTAEEEREIKFKKKQRLERARFKYLNFLNDPTDFVQGVKYHMIDKLTEELSQYLDMVDVTRVLTNMLEYLYDPATRPEDPVAYFANLTKDRKKDKRELNKARRQLYRLLWKEYEVREEIEQLKIVLWLACPELYNEDGSEKTPEEKEEYMRAEEDLSLNKRPASEEVLKETLASLTEYSPAIEQPMPILKPFSKPIPELKSAKYVRKGRSEMTLGGQRPASIKDMSEGEEGEEDEEEKDGESSKKTSKKKKKSGKGDKKKGSKGGKNKKDAKAGKKKGSKPGKNKKSKK